MHAHSGCGPTNTTCVAELREPWRPVIIFAYAQRECGEQVRAELERVCVCRRLVKQLACARCWLYSRARPYDQAWIKKTPAAAIRV